MMKRLIYNDFSRYIILIIPFMIIVFGIYEAVLGYLQLFEILPSGNHRFPATGSFFNPGPYCAFLACILPFTVESIIPHRWKIMEYTGWCYLILSVALMPWLMGRIGWLGGLVGASFVWLMMNDNLQRFKNFFLRRKLYFFAFTIAAILIILLIYQLKPASALGRIFLWRIDTDAWLENFWTGVGWEKVAGAIGDAQEKYFATHPDSFFAKVAGCPEYAFNEYFQFAIAFGAGGLLLFLILISAGIYFSSKSRQYGVTGSWISFAIVCIASYPLQFAEFRWLIVALCILTIIDINKKSQNRGRWSALIIKCLLCILFILSGWLMTRDSTNIHDISEEYFEEGKSLRRRGDFEESNNKFIEGMSYSSDPMFLNMIGRNMQDMGRYEEAEKYYLRSINRLPSRLYPRYLLAKLYASPAYFSPEKFRKIYEETLHLEIKVSSPAVSDMQRELHRLNDSIQSLPSRLIFEIE